MKCLYIHQHPKCVNFFKKDLNNKEYQELKH